ncbi:hypothetical protein WV31_02215 [Magnetospirillum sp. ME-1]|nr:hypothetical protein WV31_02215 [Magnetospirillum sp. ME-1]
MVRPAAKREAVAHLRSQFEMSERRACAVIAADRTMIRYRSVWPDDKAQRIAQGIDDGVDLDGQPAARTPDRTSFRPPFLPAACWCARTMVESIMTYSKSGSSAIMAKSRSHTPSLDQREKR